MKITTTLITVSLSISILFGCGQKSYQEQVAKNYKNVAECAADINPDATLPEKNQRHADCQSAFDQALVAQRQQAPTYNSLDDCVAKYGQGECTNNGGLWEPVMMGFMLGYVANSIVSQPIY